MHHQLALPMPACFWKRQAAAIAGILSCTFVVLTRVYLKGVPCPSLPTFTAVVPSRKMSQLSLTTADNQLVIPQFGGEEVSMRKKGIGRRHARKGTFESVSDDEDDDEIILTNPEAEIGHRHYQVLTKLGEGSFAYCVKLRHQSTRSIYCGKVMPKRRLREAQTKKLKKLPPATRLSLLNCQTEVEIHSGLAHPGIVQFHEWFCDQASGKVCCLLEYCRHGTLRSVLDQCPGKILPREMVQRWTHQLLSALAYLHEAPVLVAHRDINPSNLLIDAAFSLRLSDFGLASRLSQEGGRQLEGVMCASVGTLNYIAPEVVLKQANGANDLRAADVWSSGVVMYEMLMGRVPFALQPDDDEEDAAGSPGDSNSSRRRPGGSSGSVGLEDSSSSSSSSSSPARMRLCAGSAEVIGAALHRDSARRPTARFLSGHYFFLAPTTTTRGGSGGGDEEEEGGDEGGSMLTASMALITSIDSGDDTTAHGSACLQLLAADPSFLTHMSTAIIPLPPQTAAASPPATAAETLPIIPLLEPPPPPTPPTTLDMVLPVPLLSTPPPPTPFQLSFGSLALDHLDTRWVQAAEATWMSMLLRNKNQSRRRRRRIPSGDAADESVTTERTNQGSRTGSVRNSGSASSFSSNDLSWPDSPVASFDDESDATSGTLRALTTQSNEEARDLAITPVSNAVARRRDRSGSW